MNNSSKTILWLGLLMFVLQIVSNWPQIRAVIFSSPTGGSPFNAPLIPPLTPPLGKGKGGTGKEPPPAEEPPPVEVPPVVPEVPVVLAHYIAPSKG